MTDPTSLGISIAALCVSGLTLWLTFLYRGTVRITKPGFVAFSYETMTGTSKIAKILMRGLIYSTGSRGHVIENMYLNVRAGENERIFNIWSYGDEKFSRGGGLFVNQIGIAVNHHFLPPWDSEDFTFIPGDYELQLFAVFPNARMTCKLCVIKLTVPESFREAIKDRLVMIWFDWSPDSKQYIAHIEHRH